MSYDFVANFIRFPAVEKFLKSVKIWQKLQSSKVGTFFATQKLMTMKNYETCNLWFAKLFEIRRVIKYVYFITRVICLTYIWLIMWLSCQLLVSAFCLHCFFKFYWEFGSVFLWFIYRNYVYCTKQIKSSNINCHRFGNLWICPGTSCQLQPNRSKYLLIPMNCLSSINRRRYQFILVAAIVSTVCFTYLPKKGAYVISVVKYSKYLWLQLLSTDVLNIQK